MSLPALVPSQAANDAAAAVLAMRGAGAEWADVPTPARYAFRATVVSIFNPAAPHLLADVVEYLVANNKAFGFSAHTVDQLIDAAVVARAAAETSPDDPFAG